MSSLTSFASWIWGSGFLRVFGMALLYNYYMKITTKTGDKGNTGLLGGIRVSKGSLVIEVLGNLDELQAFIGACKCDVLECVQDDLSRIMAIIAGSEGDFDEGRVAFLENKIEEYESLGKNLSEFVRPESRFHLARVVCRRCERVFVRYIESLGNGVFESSAVILRYLNRLSDLLFLLACRG